MEGGEGKVIYHIKFHASPPSRRTYTICILRANFIFCIHILHLAVTGGRPTIDLEPYKNEINTLFFRAALLLILYTTLSALHIALTTIPRTIRRHLETSGLIR